MPLWNQKTENINFNNKFKRINLNTIWKLKAEGNLPVVLTSLMVQPSPSDPRDPENKIHGEEYRYCTVHNQMMIKTDWRIKRDSLPSSLHNPFVLLTLLVLVCLGLLEAPLIPIGHNFQYLPVKNMLWFTDLNSRKLDLADTGICVLQSTD